MKTLGKSLFGATAATALAVASASPAHAQNRDGIDGGDILTGVLIAGAAAAVIAAVSDNDRDRYDDDRYDDYRYGDRSYDRYGRYGYTNMSPRAAVRQCAQAAQRQASRYGPAQITEISDVDRKRDGYKIRGRLRVDESRYTRNSRYGWNDRYGRYDPYGRSARYDRRDWDNGRFSCEIRHGRIRDVDIDGI